MTGEIDYRRVKRILVLNMIANTIGDSLFVTPLFRILKKKFPESHIVVTATSTNRDLFTNNPYLDEIIYLPELAKVGDPVNSKATKIFAYFRSLVRIVGVLRRGKYDLCLVGVPTFSPLHLIPLLSGIRYSAGYEAPGMYFSFLLTKKGPFRGPNDAGGEDRHYLDSVLDLLRFAGIEFDEKDAVVEKALTSEEIKRSGEILLAQGISSADPYVCIQAGAKWKSKCWPKERYALLSRRIADAYGFKVLLLGSPGEAALNEDIKKLAGEGVINLSGELSLTEIAGIMKKARMVVGNDSGLMHLSSAVGTITVVLYGSTNPKHSRPKGTGKAVEVFRNDFCPPCTINKADCPNNYRCMDAISVEDVLEAVQKNL